MEIETVKVVMLKGDKGDTGGITVEEAQAAVASAVASETASLQQQIDVNSGRIDNFTTLPNGSTTGDAELNDIRVSYNGHIYPNAGDAVRGQVSDLKNSISNSHLHTYEEPFAVWSQGGLTLSAGTEYDSAANVRTAMLNVRTDRTIYITRNPSLALYVHVYDANGVQISRKSIQGTSYVPESEFIRFRASTDSSVAIAPKDVGITFSYSVGRIPNGDDINRYYISGEYDFNASQISTIIGLPSEVNTPCTLKVFSVNGKYSHCVQALYSHIGKHMFIRFHDDNYDANDSSVGWSEWNDFTPTSQGRLPDNANINTYWKSGEYDFTSEQTSGIIGLPDGYVAPGTIKVINGLDGFSHAVQVIYRLGGNRFYIRFHDDNYDVSDPSVGWSEWNEYHSVPQMRLPDNADINRYYTAGIYDFVGSQTSGMTGLPDGYVAPGSLNIISVNGSYDHCVQVLYRLGGNRCYVRFHDNNYDENDSSVGWSDWNVYYSEPQERLPDGANINTYYTSGTYDFVGSQTSGMTGLPGGFNVPGTLVVYSINGSYNHCVQVLYRLGGKKFFVRFHDDNYDENDSSVGWSDWNDPTGNFSASDYLKRSVSSGLKPKGLMGIYINGDVSEMSHDVAVPVTWYYVTNKSGTVLTEQSETYTGTLKIQGRGSLAFPKKNYTLKSDTNIDFGWGLQKKYVLKGNYLDSSEVGNLTGAKLWGKIAADHADNYPAQLVQSPNYGAIDGIIVMVTLNGQYLGVYNLNIPKDKWMANMTLAEGTKECIICSDASVRTCQWKELAATLEDLQTGWCLEELSDGISEDVALRALNQAIESVIIAYNNRDRNWETTVGQYVDIDSAIDYMILRCMIGDTDGMITNQLLMTYNLVDPETEPAIPTKWYFVPYDMDRAFLSPNLYYDDDAVREIEDTFFDYYAGLNRLFWLIYNYSTDKLKARYTALRNAQLSYREVYYLTSNLCGQIPAGLIDQEHKMWPLTPGNNVMNLAHITDFYRINAELCDKKLLNQ